jgi:hypothetical protein
MEPLKRKGGKGPEWYIRDRVIKLLQGRGWLVKIVHASMFSEGFPDIYATHKEHGMRWIEIKLPDMEGSRWTKAQLDWFPKLAANGTPIWVLTNSTESEYKKLFGPDNWFEYFLLKH